MDLSNFIRLAQIWHNLGDAVRKQIEDAALGDGVDKQNPNALARGARALDDLARGGIDGAAEAATEIREHLETLKADKVKND